LPWTFCCPERQPFRQAPPPRWSKWSQFTVPNVNRSGKLHYVGVNALVDDLSLTSAVQASSITDQQGFIFSGRARVLNVSRSGRPCVGPTSDASDHTAVLNVSRSGKLHHHWAAESLRPRTSTVQTSSTATRSMQARTPSCPERQPFRQAPAKCRAVHMPRRRPERQPFRQTPPHTLSSSKSYPEHQPLRQAPPHDQFCLCRGTRSGPERQPLRQAPCRHLTAAEAAPVPNVNRSGKLRAAPIINRPEQSFDNTEV
jgi:hypothetical protein